MIGWLATGSRLAKYGYETTTCHRCGQRKTSDHLFQCPLRFSDNATLIHDLGLYLTSSGIEQWLSQSDQSVPPNLTAAKSKCWNHQTALGWNKPIRGIFTTHWGELQCNTTDDDKWQTSVCSWITTRAHAEWKSRNSERHPTIPGAISQQELETIAQVRKLYEIANT
jgi:hypothetical protein